MIGKTILHYKIIEKLGQGGMGIVYLAEDTKLERKVAIKFLPHHIASDSDERKRFEIEAKAVAALNHPNIATIHNIDETEGEYFLVMEYISGKHLKDYLKTKLLSVEETTDIAIQIACGLEEAHNKGVVHRDIKSSNIMSNEKGRIKIMDFGLAKLGKGIELTKELSTLGTAAYMSPEQARGEEVDHRSDIWSFGIVFYEMLTGTLPFKGDYEQAVIFNILNEQADTEAHPIPERLKGILNKSLAKDPAERYQDAGQLLADLQNITRPVMPSNARRINKNPVIFGAILVLIFVLAAAVLWNPFADPFETIDSIAVLPLENISNDPEQEYFVDGMTEAIITELSKIKAIRVISRTSVMPFKGVKKSLSDIAHELNVNALLEGSVIQTDGKVRITVQLIALDPERHLWASSFDRDLTGFLSLSGEVAIEIAREIRVSLSPEEKERLSIKRKVDPEANRLLLRAKYQMQKSTEKESTLKAIEFINESLKIDSGFALAYAGLASAYLKFNNTGYASYEDVLPKIEWAVNKALEIDSTLEEAHSIQSNIQFKKNRDYNKREKKIKRVIEQNPSSLDGHYDYLYFLRDLGRHQEALRELKIIQQLDPLSEFLYSTAAQTYFSARKWDKAIENFRFDLELDPDNINTKWWLARAYAHNGNYEEAFAEFLSRNVKSSETNWALGCAYAAAGYPEKARKILNFLLEKEKTTYVPSNYIARLFIALEDYDNAFEYFDKGGWIDSILNDPLLDPVRKDPRFKKFVRKWNFPQNIEESVLNGGSIL